MIFISTIRPIHFGISLIYTINLSYCIDKFFVQQPPYLMFLCTDYHNFIFLYDVRRNCWQKRTVFWWKFSLITLLYEIIQMIGSMDHISFPNDCMINVYDKEIMYLTHRLFPRAKLVTDVLDYRNPAGLHHRYWMNRVMTDIALNIGDISWKNRNSCIFGVIWRNPSQTLGSYMTGNRYYVGWTAIQIDFINFPLFWRFLLFQ